ncbi:MAG: ArsR family transcriptional regulator [Rhodospirillales bacterium RIFCSPLOWO2_12_FULL_67_15]|nr:MAG: ArsR family transcriptional regulator [Rhodospirillales bacterium RIFCSPLOWO2_12_FULL_67_15]
MDAKTSSPAKLHTIQTNALRASALLKAMSNQHRLMILCQLVPGEKSVGELERIIGLSQSALSQHLARLRRDQMVKTRRAAQTIYYSLNGEEASAVIETLYDLYCGATATLTLDNPNEAPRTVAMR